MLARKGGGGRWYSIPYNTPQALVSYVIRAESYRMQGANGGIPLRVGLLFVVVADWVREGREGGGGRYVSSLDGACEGTKAYDGHAEFAVWTDEFCF